MNNVVAVSAIPAVLTSEILCDLMTTAIEGGSYWIEIANPHGFFDRALKSKVLPFYSNPDFYMERNEFITFSYDAGDVIETSTLDVRNVHSGWHQLCREYPSQADSILAGTYDAYDADLFLQLCLFGKEVYS